MVYFHEKSIDFILFLMFILCHKSKKLQFSLASLALLNQILDKILELFYFFFESLDIQK